MYLYVVVSEDQGRWTLNFGKGIHYVEVDIAGLRRARDLSGMSAVDQLTEYVVRRIEYGRKVPEDCLSKTYTVSLCEKEFIRFKLRQYKDRSEPLRHVFMPKYFPQEDKMTSWQRHGF